MPSKRKVDVLIVGSLAGNDLVLAEHLSRKGLHCRVLRHASHPVNQARVGVPPHYFTHFKLAEVLYYKNSFQFISEARKAKLVCSLTGSLIDALGRLWALRYFLRLPPVVNLMTGSDMTETMVEDSAHGRRYRSYLKFVDLNWGAPYVRALDHFVRFRVKNLVFLRFPYFLPEAISSPQGINKSTLRFFHPSNLDWKLNDPGAHRNSDKGNDRFIRAFAKAVKTENLSATCIILDRGPDASAAKKMIQDLGVSDHFVWKPHLSRDELISEIQQADVVVDQFTVGGLGGIAAEAMSMGKPVMTYLDSQYERLFYAEDAPVLNCSSEDEIFRQLVKCKQPEFLFNLGKLGSEWVKKYHHYDRTSEGFLFYFKLLTSGGE